MLRPRGPGPTLRPHSATRLGVYEACPLQFKLRYVDVVDEVVDNEFLKLREEGRLGHEFCFELFRRQLKGRRPGKEERAAIANQIFDTQEHGLRESHRQDFLRLCRSASYHLRDVDLTKLPPETEVMLEQKLAVGLDGKATSWENREALLRLKPDFFWVIGDAAQVLEFKLGWLGAKKDPFQLEVYAFGILCLYPHLTRIKLDYRYARVGTRESFVFERPQLLQVKRRLLSLIRRVERDREFEQRRGDACRVCPVAHACTAKPSGLLTASTREEAKEIALDYLLEEARQKARQKAIKAFCQQRGDLQVDGVTFSVKPQTVETYDMRGSAGPAILDCPKCGAKVAGAEETVFDKLIRSVGKNPDDFKRLDTKKVKGLMADAAVGALLNGLKRRRTQRRFTKKKGD